jgi:hypothetical protein
MVGKVYCPVSAPGESVGVVNLSCRSYTAPFLLGALGELGIPYHYYTSWPEDFNEHDLWFIHLGVFAFNHVLSSDEAKDIVAALKAGKNIYLEGGDTWCYDPEKTTLGPWFGVAEDARGWVVNSVVGESGTLLDGIKLIYADEVEDICIDRFFAISPAEVLLRSNGSQGMGVTVINDAGGYRSIASSVPLGGLVDGVWPDTRKEILIRYLEFFGMDHIQLMAAAAAQYGTNVPVRIEAEPGHEYLLLASLADNYLPSAYGLFRLSFDYLFFLSQGVILPTGSVRIELPIPRDEALLGLEVHLQAFTGKKVMPPQDAHFTNREILTIVE